VLSRKRTSGIRKGIASGEDKGTKGMTCFHTKWRSDPGCFTVLFFASLRERCWRKNVVSERNERMSEQANKRASVLLFKRQEKSEGRSRDEGNDFVFVVWLAHEGGEQQKGEVP
jgi:hypothetical protein